MPYHPPAVLETCPVRVLPRPYLSAAERVAGLHPIHLDMEWRSAAYLFTQTDEADQLAISDLEVERRASHDLNKTWEAALAVRTYTEQTQFYTKFNEELRTHGESDAICAHFPFKSAHYMLSVALGTLWWASPNTSYRGIKSPSEGSEGSSMRLGQLALSSLDREEALEFGKATLFTIESWLGAPIGRYSRFPDEEEVLTPSWEEFNIVRSINSHT
ncbi:NAD(P)(+)--arginine ADP-ribosyltransferase 1-like [Narcine bancroftii]|uniref:NAD(P)(+)--arginine ADP-ribosyltransferase 1-like n=1 Tax=Narcine bancroftii TaxID=1343680 RepID=UPI0038310BF0